MKKIVLFLLLLGGMRAETLPGLIDYAMKHSVGVLQGEAAVGMADLDRQLSVAAMGGELNLVGSATHYNIERTLAPVPPSAMKSKTPITTSKEIFSLGLAYNVPLFTGGAQTRQVTIDRLGAEIARIGAHLSREQVAYNVRTLYLSLLAQDGFLSAQNHYIASLKKLTEQIRSELAAGKKAQVDLLKAQADLSAAQTQAETLRSGIEMTRAGLSAVVGRKVGRLRPVTIRLRRPHYRIATLMKQAHHLGKIRSEDIAVEQTRQRRLKAEAASAPQIALSAFVGKNFGQDIHTDAWDDKEIAQIGLNAKFNLFDFGKRSAGREKARIARMRAQLKRRQALLDLRRQLTQAVEKIRQSYTAYLGATKVQQLSRKSLEIERARYKSGTATLNDLLMAESKYRLAAAKTVESKYTYQKNIYYLDFVLEKGAK